MPERSSSSPRITPLTVFVGIVAILAVILPTALLHAYPLGNYHDSSRIVALVIAGLILLILNQLNFTIRFSGQADNVEITFTEAALVAMFYTLDPGAVVLLSGVAHFIREMQAHRRRQIQVVFNTSEIIVSVSLAGFVYSTLCAHLGPDYIVAAIVAAMLTHSISNRLLVGTVICINSGRFHTRYYHSLFVENVVMLFMNLALGMTAVMALLLNRPYLLWVPASILAVVYVAYQAYVDQIRDASTLARLYENANLSGPTDEASLIPLALTKALDTFSSREARLTMSGGPGSLAEWCLKEGQKAPVSRRMHGSLLELPGANAPTRISTDEPHHARAWRQGSRYNGMAVPVQFEGQMLGILSVEKPRAWDAFTAGDLRAFGLYARQLGIGLENARLTELDREQQRLRQKALDAERNRISRDLHDSFVQTLVQVDLHLAYLQKLQSKRPEDVPGELADIQKAVQAGLAEARSYMAELKPLRIDPGEFNTVAQRYLDDFSNQNGTLARFETDEREVDLPADDLTELFQMIREGLNNVAKHAHAHNVIVGVETTDTHVEVRVQDDGVGFDVSRVQDFRREGHFGLANICERANGMGGAVDWASSPDAGTILTISIPRPISPDVLKGMPE